MKNRDGLENNDNWKTPTWLYEVLDNLFYFNFDPCPLYHDLRQWNGLEIDWGYCNFVNPPYNRIDKPRFILKAYDEYKLGKTSVLLLPAATGNNVYHDVLRPYADIIPIRGRISFEGVNTQGDFVTTGKGKSDSMICVFYGENMPQYKTEYLYNLINTAKHERSNTKRKR